jgi:hypothetical protein
MVSYKGDNKYSLDGKDFEIPTQQKNYHTSVYRLEDCLILKNTHSSNSNPYVTRFTKDGYEIAEVSQMGNMITRPDPDRNEYLIENDYYGGGVNDYKPSIHIYQNYIVYKNEDGKFCEYGGLEVPIKDFLEIDGAWDFFTDEFSDSGNYMLLYNVLYRENGIINVNVIEMISEGYFSDSDLKYPGTRHTYMFRYENGKLENLNGGDSNGWYDKSTYEKYMTVTYPEKLPLFGADENDIELYVD